MEHTGNHITLCGTLRALPEYSHSNHERRFFRFELDVERLSGTADVLPVMAAEDVLMEADLFAGGRFLVEGQIRSFNSRAESGRRLIISVFAESVTTTEQPPQNDAVLTGTICKPPIYRSTPFGREICDMMLAVNRAFGKSDYIPCIAWGRNAQYAARFGVGDHIRLSGRLQSREYQKLLENGEYMVRNAYEVSAFTLESADAPAAEFIPQARNIAVPQKPETILN